MMIDNEKVGRAIGACRRAANLSQQELAARMNVTHQAVSKWENGAALPDTATLLGLSRLFGVTMEALLLGTAGARETRETVEERRIQDASETRETVEERRIQDASETWETRRAEEERRIQDASETWETAERTAQASETWKTAERTAQASETRETTEVSETVEEPMGASSVDSEDVFAGFEVLEGAEGEAELPSGGLDARDIAELLPFVSGETADQLFARAVESGTLTPGRLSLFAPFVSAEKLDAYVAGLIDSGLAQAEIRLLLTELAPFLRKQTLERLIEGDFGAMDIRLMKELLPFVGTQKANELVTRILHAKLGGGERGENG